MLAEWGIGRERRPHQDLRPGRNAQGADGVSLPERLDNTLHRGRHFTWNTVGPAAQVQTDSPNAYVINRYYDPQAGQYPALAQTLEAYEYADDNPSPTPTRAGKCWWGWKYWHSRLVDWPECLRCMYDGEVAQPGGCVRVVKSEGWRCNL